MRRLIARSGRLWRALIVFGILVIIADLVGTISPPEGIVWILGVVAMIVAGILLAQIAPRAETPRASAVAGSSSRQVARD